MREKLGAELRKYCILSACNPALAQRALNQDLEAGLVLLCTVVIYEEGSGSEMSIADPMIVVDLLGDLALRPIAEEAQAKLKRALMSIQGQKP